MDLHGVADRGIPVEAHASIALVGNADMERVVDIDWNSYHSRLLIAKVWEPASVLSLATDPDLGIRCRQNRL